MRFINLFKNDFNPLRDQSVEDPEDFDIHPNWQNEIKESLIQTTLRVSRIKSTFQLLQRCAETSYPYLWLCIGYSSSCIVFVLSTIAFMIFLAEGTSYYVRVLRAISLVLCFGSVASLFLLLFIQTHYMDQFKMYMEYLKFREFYLSLRKLLRTDPNRFSKPYWIYKLSQEIDQSEILDSVLYRENELKSLIPKPLPSYPKYHINISVNRLDILIKFDSHENIQEPAVLFDRLFD